MVIFISATRSTPKEYNLPTELKDKLSVCSVPVAISHIKFSGTSPISLTGYGSLVDDTRLLLIRNEQS